MSPGGLASGAALVRAADWWAYKIAPLAGMGAAAAILAHDISPARLAAIGVALAAVCAVAVYGYVLNDVCDVEDDERSGRANRMAGVGWPLRAALLLGSAATAGALATRGGTVTLPALVGLDLLLPTLYSVPPIRLKERGVWGVLADAGAAHLLPTAIVVSAAMGDAWAGGVAMRLFAAAAVTCSFLAGMRGILVHQVADRAADAQAAVYTYVMARGVPAVRRLVLTRLLPAEAASLAVMLAAALPRAPAAAVAVVLFAGVEAIRMARGWTLPLFAAGNVRERYLPLVSNELYEAWLPLGFLVQLAILDRRWAWLPIAQVLAFRRSYATRVREVVRTIGDVRGGRPAATDRDGAAAAPMRRRVRLSRDLPVVAGATYWTVNGVNVFSANLVRGLRANGTPAHILLTEENTRLIRVTEPLMPRAPDLPFAELPVAPTDGWGRHWARMVRYLDDRGPCIYIPNSDWRHSAVCPRLSDRVIVVGVVHSDDPLHYDHVSRLGSTWNAIVAVSDAVAERTRTIRPELADRITTIPIGVPVPRTPPPERAPSDVLRLVYHGVLKQHQKRVLDLPSIVRAAAARGVPVRLVIAGAGPDEAALRASAADLVEQGLVRFEGVVAPDAAGALLATEDVYLLASEFEGMPNALIEAMGHGCVPVVSRMTSGIPQLLRDGENGFLAPVGDVAAFADRLDALWRDPARRRGMAAAAYASVARAPYRVEDMVDGYTRVFDRAYREVQAGRFHRFRGPLSLPPPEVAGVRLWQVPLTYEEPGVGPFPGEDDAEEYVEESGDPAVADRVPLFSVDRPARVAPRRFGRKPVRVFFAAPVWTGNGVNRWSEDMVRGLRQRGVDARLLLTEENTELVRVTDARLPRPTDVPIEELEVPGPDCWGARWGAMIRLLEDAAPSVYVPNFDWRHSCVASRLSNAVSVIGVVHDAGPLYRDHARRMGRFWNAMIGTDRHLTRGIRANVPELVRRSVTIRYGLAIPAEAPGRALAPDHRLRTIVLTADSRMEWGAILAGCRPWLGTMTVVSADGGVPDAPSGWPVLTHWNRQQWLDLCRSSDLVIAASRGEPAERLTLEAMGHGCVPILAAGDDAGDPLAADGSGIVLPGVDHLAAELSRLATDPSGLPEMSARARARARVRAFTADQMIEAFLALLGQVRAERFRRPSAPLSPPPARVGAIDIFPIDAAFRTSAGTFPAEKDARAFEALQHGRSPLALGRTGARP